MRNRAKCKLCNSIIESFHIYDYVPCKCGEISIDGGPGELKCASKNWINFLRVDDEGNEIVVSVQEKDNLNQLDIDMKPTKKDMIDMLEGLIKSYERLPSSAMSQPVSHADFCSLSMLLLSIFREDCKDSI